MSDKDAEMGSMKKMERISVQKGEIVYSRMTDGPLYSEEADFIFTDTVRLGLTILDYRIEGDTIVVKVR